MSPPPDLIPRPLTEGTDLLGESPVWQAETGRLLWLDLAQPRLNSIRPDGSALRRLPLSLPPPLGMVAPTDQPGIVILAHREGLDLLDIDSGRLTPLADPNEGRAEIVYNDGKIDRAGRLWIGTSDAGEREPRGIIYMRHPEGRFQLADAGFAVCNGPAFGLEGNTVYVSDSAARRILRYQLTGGSLPFASRAVFVTLPEGEGVPDGLAVDDEDHVWCAHWGGACLSRFGLDGKRVLRIPLPAPLVTGCCFGGEDRATLFVTTARAGLDATALAAAPLSGALFRLRPGVAGPPERALKLLWN